MLTRHPSPAAPVGHADSGVPGAAPGSNSPVLPGVLDEQALDRLRELDPGGKNHLMERVVSAFETSVARLMPQLDQAQVASDMSGIRHVAHTLKSSSASIGAMELSRICAEIETRARHNQPEGMNERITQMQTEVEVVRAALKKIPGA